MSSAALAIEDIRATDPIAYIRAIGLRPEDSYGFLPLEIQEGPPSLFLYRDSPEYAERRASLPAAQSAVPGMGETMDLDLSGGLSEVMEQARRLRDAGALEMPEPAAASASGELSTAPAPSGAPEIVAQRLYPGLRMRSSTRQLDDFMPDYRELVQLCPDDVYGVYPRDYGTVGATNDDAGSTEWDDYWVVYRDRPEYAAGREAWAEKMSKKKRTWPEPESLPGVAAASGSAFDGGKVQVKKERWPRRKLVIRKKDSELADELRAKIGKWGYEPEDSLGFCPGYGNGTIYFAWRKR